MGFERDFAIIVTPQTTRPSNFQIQGRLDTNSIYSTFGALRWEALRFSAIKYPLSGQRVRLRPLRPLKPAYARLHRRVRAFRRERKRDSLQSYMIRMKYTLETSMYILISDFEALNSINILYLGFMKT